MKKQITLVLILLTTVSLAQEPIPRGSIGVGGFLACPQSELKTVQYDPGPGLNINYLSVKFPYKSQVNFQVGARVDFASMKKKEFEVEINTPVADNGDYTVRNSMAGIFVNGRINYGYDTKFTPFIDLLAGNRGFTTNADLYAQNPELNPDFEESAFYNRVVHTSRFHYGGGVGFTYDLGKSVQFESSVIYTFGEAGAVQPLVDVVKDINEIRYNFSENTKTDLLLINAGFRFKLWKRTRTYSPTPSTPSTPTSTETEDDVSKRYKDPETTTTPESDKPTKTSDPIIKGRDSGTETDETPKGKTGIGVKGNNKKSGSDID